MNNIDIYTKTYCPFCKRAKALLDAKGVSYRELEVSTDQALQQQMRERSGRRTVPQIFINNHHIGGSDDLIDANNSGLLDELLGQQTSLNA
ncbi:glutaredoxin 3 [Granulosicoccus sp. 3-233]|uniref:glutaredoxin 3 n=1 Tax=Granulosicoccus sp. 3-233 TaxID=3417969 RepID=UPI003D34BBDF